MKHNNYIYTYEGNFRSKLGSLLSLYTVVIYIESLIFPILYHFKNTSGGDVCFFPLTSKKCRDDLQGAPVSAGYPEELGFLEANLSIRKQNKSESKLTFTDFTVCTSCLNYT